MRPGDFVRVVRSSSVLYKDEVHRVAVVVSSGHDYHGVITGPALILDPRYGNPDACTYPYAWDAARFEITNERPGPRPK